MAVKQDLSGIVGSKHVSDDHRILLNYSHDNSFVKPVKPSCVVFPKSTQEVQELVKYANDKFIPLIPRSSRISFYGAGIPSQGGVIVDLTRMNKILEINALNKMVTVEPGVTWSQIQSELEKQGLTVSNPLLPHSLKSVFTSALEREPILTPKPEYSETLLTGEIVLPNGEIFWLGTALGKGMVGRKFRDGMIPSTRVFTGAQGALGIVTWAKIKLEYLPTMNKLFFIPFETIDNAIEPIYRIQQRMLGRECFVLNNVELAAILAGKMSVKLDALRNALPPWTVILCLTGLNRYPLERIAYEEEALEELATQLHFQALPALGGIPGMGKAMLEMLRKPWAEEVYWKFAYKGSCHEVFFHTTLDRVPEFTGAMEAVAARHGYPVQDIAQYIQPLEHARACFCQYGFYCDPGNTVDVEKVRNLYLAASELAINMGGLFSTPYGPWAEMVYRRAGAYTSLAKLVKSALDPNNIMNPDKLCF